MRSLEITERERQELNCLSTEWQTWSSSITLNRLIHRGFVEKRYVPHTDRRRRDKVEYRKLTPKEILEKVQK